MNKSNYNNDNICEIYMGTYKNKIYAVSQSRDLVFTYLHTMRKLDVDKFKITKQTIFESELTTEYEDQVLVEYNGYYIPNIDVVLIGLHSKELCENMNNTIDELKRYIVLSNEVKRVKE